MTISPESLSAAPLLAGALIVTHLLTSKHIGSARTKCLATTNVTREEKKMAKYDIKDAVMLKECMKQIALIAAKYPDFVGKPYLDGLSQDLKTAIEFIQDMVEKNV